LSIDLLRDRLRGVARDRAAEPRVAERKIWFGILEGALEHEVLPLATTSDAGKPRRTSTSGSLNSTGAIALRGGDVDQIASHLREANLAAAAVRALERKKVLVLAGRGSAPAAGWWEIAADGTTYAVLGQDEAHGSRTYFPPTSVPLGSTGGGGAGRGVPGVVPHDPPSPFRGPHIPRPHPGGGPFPTDPGVEYAPGYGPGGRTGGTGAGNQGGAKGGGKGGDGEQGSGAAEYVGIVKEQSVPNAFAVLEEFVDKFFLATSNVAIRVGTVLDDFFSLFAP
jgi:hypothetical protein